MAAMAKASTPSASRSKLVNGILVNGALGLICLLWMIPLLGLLISSFRDRSDIVSSGWWTVFPHQEYVRSNQVQLTKGLPLDQPIQVEGVTLSDDQLRAGYNLPDGRRVIWANRRARLVDVQNQQWAANTNFTLSNYQNVLLGQQFTYTQPDGTTKIRLVTDRPIRFGEAWSDSRSSDYNLSGLEITLSPDKKKNEGVLLPACQFKLDKENNLQIEAFENPWKLTNIMRR